jgi:hypothetical protein
MVIEHIVDIPADYRISLELPHSIPAGSKARIEISVPAADAKSGPASLPFAKMEDVWPLLHQEMAEKGTLEAWAETGDGWAAHVRERYAEP